MQADPRPLMPVPDGILEHCHAPAIQLKRASRAKIGGNMVRRRLFRMGDEHALWLPSEKQLSDRLCDLAHVMLCHPVGNTQKSHPIGRPAQPANRLDRLVLAGDPQCLPVNPICMG